jgi:hypothetical protein
MRGRRGTALAAVLLLGLVTGCTSPSDATPSPSSTAEPTASTPPTEDASSSPSPSPTSERQRAVANVEAFIPEYYRVLDEVSQDPASAESLSSVTISRALSVWQNEYQSWRDDGRRQVGEPQRILEVDVQSVDLDNSDPEQGVVPTVIVDICYDVSDVEVVDEKGNSVVQPDRPDRGWERLYVANYEYEDDPDGAWRVADGETLERQTCTAA